MQSSVTQEENCSNNNLEDVWISKEEAKECELLVTSFSWP